MTDRAKICFVALGLFVATASCETTAPTIGEDELPFISAETVTDTLVQFTTDISAGGREKSATVVALCARGARAATTLESHARTCEIGISQRYYDSLTYDMDTVREGLRSIGREAEALVVFGIESLEVKASHAIAKPRRWAKPVKVRVHTVRDKQPVKGLQVWFCSRVTGPVRHQYWRTFDIPSTPAIHQLPPGIYNLAPEGSRAEVIRVGGRGQAEQTFTVQIRQD